MKLICWDGDLFCFDLAPLCARWFVVIWFVIVRMAIVRRSCEWSCDWQSVSPLLPYMLSCCYILDVALNNLNECCYSDSYREHLCFSAKSLVKTSIYPGWQAGIFSRKAQRLPRLFSSNCPQTSLLSIQSQSWKMSNLLHGPISTNQILPQEKRVNRDIFGTSNLQNRTYGVSCDE